MAFALEQAIDEAALRMNVDPIACANAGIPNPIASASMIGLSA